MGDLWAQGGIKVFYNGLGKNYFRRVRWLELDLCLYA